MIRKEKYKKTKHTNRAQDALLNVHPSGGGEGEGG